MPELSDLNTGSPLYIRPIKVNVDSEDANVTRRSVGGDFSYSVRLSDEYKNVVAIELSGFNLPNKIAPTFVPAEGLRHGNNKLDFMLDDGVTPTVFSLTWPSTAFSYENVISNVASYIDVLPQLMAQAIIGDPTYDGNVEFFASPDPSEVTSISVRALAPTFLNEDDVELTFLFATGANAANSAWSEMGFLQNVDVTSTSFAGVQRLVGPLKTDLNPFRYVDIFVAQAPEHQPLQRVFFRNLLALTTTQNDVVKPVRLLATPIPFLTTLDITLRLKNNITPVASNTPHDLLFTIYVAAPEHTVPAWVTQVFTL